MLFTKCDFAGGICKESVPAIFAEPRCHLHTKLQPVVYRYSGCEQEVCCFVCHIEEVCGSVGTSFTADLHWRVFESCRLF